MTSYFWEVPLAETPRRMNAAVVIAALTRVAIAPIVAGYRAWSRYRTERLLEGLPMEVRKDIGYRSAEDIDLNRLR